MTIVLQNNFGMNGNGFCQACGKKLPKRKLFWCNAQCCNLAMDRLIKEEGAKWTKKP